MFLPERLARAGLGSSIPDNGLSALLGGNVAMNSAPATSTLEQAVVSGGCRPWSRLLLPADVRVRLGVWAAEGNENLQKLFDLSERRWLHYLDEAKGSGTPENVTFFMPFLLPPRLLDGVYNP